MTCRIFLDQQISVDVAQALRRFGHDGLSARDANLLGTSDDMLLSFAAEQGRIFISGDYRDFVRLSIEWNEAGRDFPGIVLVGRGGTNYTPGGMAARIEQHVTPNPARLQNSLTWLPALE